MLSTIIHHEYAVLLRETTERFCASCVLLASQEIGYVILTLDLLDSDKVQCRAASAQCVVCGVELLEPWLDSEEIRRIQEHKRNVQRRFERQLSGW